MCEKKNVDNEEIKFTSSSCYFYLNPCQDFRVIGRREHTSRDMLRLEEPHVCPGEDGCKACGNVKGVRSQSQKQDQNDLEGPE